MRILISNALKTSEIECGRAGKVLRTRNTRNQSPQNIYNLLYDIHKIPIEKPIIFSGQMPISENIVFLRGLRGLRGLV
ncbi:MAG: hypothetical protein WBZ36_10130 [Candidatus Nitrosopolaris sp.]